MLRLDVKKTTEEVNVFRQYSKNNSNQWNNQYSLEISMQFEIIQQHQLRQVRIKSNKLLVIILQLKLLFIQTCSHNNTNK